MQDTITPNGEDLSARIVKRYYMNQQIHIIIPVKYVKYKGAKYLVDGHQIVGIGK